MGYGRVDGTVGCSKLSPYKAPRKLPLPEAGEISPFPVFSATAR